MIRLITFKTNHTLLGDVEEHPYFFIIKEPVQVVMQPSKDGPMMGFVPFVEYCEEFTTGIQISKEDVLFASTPVKELVNSYNQMFGSGIQIASMIPPNLK